MAKSTREHMTDAFRRDGVLARVQGRFRSAKMKDRKKEQSRRACRGKWQD